MIELVMADAEKSGIGVTNARSQPLVTWLYFLNFATIAALCLLVLKICKILVVWYKCLFPFTQVPKCPVILIEWLGLIIMGNYVAIYMERLYFRDGLALFEDVRIPEIFGINRVLGPKNDTIQEIVRRLSRIFDSEVTFCQNFNTSEAHGPRKDCMKSQIIYTQIPIGSREMILELKAYIRKTFGFVDILVISQNEDLLEKSSTHDFLNNLNKQLLAQFWTVMAFLPEMLRQNKGIILSIALGRTSLVNTGIMRTIYEELLQCDTKVKLTLVESNAALDKCYMPSLSSDVLASFIVRSMWDSSSVVKVPSLRFYLIMLPVLLLKFLLKPMMKIFNVASAKRF